MCRTRLYGGPSRLAASRPRTCRRASAVAVTSGSVALPKSDSWRRGTIQISKGERDANGANATVGVVLPDHPIGPARLVADEAAPRALPFPDDEPGRAAQLLRDPVRDLGDVVQIEAEVVRPRSGLGTPVLDHLEVVRLGGRSGVRDCRPCPADEALDDLVADGVERPVLAWWRDDRSPAAARPCLRQRDLGERPVQLAGVLVRADDVEGEVLERPDPDPVARRQPAVLAVAAIVDQLGRRREPVAMKGAIHDGGDPPAGNRVLPELEQSCGHWLSRTGGGMRQALARRRRPRLPRTGPSPPRLVVPARSRSRWIPRPASRTDRSGRSRPGPDRY